MKTEMVKARTSIHPGPRERLMKLGEDELCESDLIAILLGTGTRGHSVFQQARLLLSTYGGLAGLFEASPEELQKMPGIGPGKASILKASFALGFRMLKSMRSLTRVLCSHDIYQHYQHMALLPEEHFIAMALDAKNRIVRESIICKGSFVSCIITPRELFSFLLKARARSAICVHNHPSHDPTPSPEDIDITHKLQEAGKILHIELLDHVIIGKENYVSMKDAGLM